MLFRHISAIFRDITLTIKQLRQHANFGHISHLFVRNDFRGHSRNSKRAKIDYTSTLSQALHHSATHNASKNKKRLYHVLKRADISSFCKNLHLIC